MLIDNTSSVHINVDLKATFKWVFFFLINSVSYEYKNKSAHNWAQFVFMKIPTECWKTWFKKTTLMLFIKISKIFLTLNSEYFCAKSKWFFRKIIVQMTDYRISKITWFFFFFLEKAAINDVKKSYTLINWVRLYKV